MLWHCSVLSYSILVEGLACGFNALLKAGSNQTQVLHDLGVALTAQPQELQTKLIQDIVV